MNKRNDEGETITSISNKLGKTYIYNYLLSKGGIDSSKLPTFLDISLMGGVTTGKSYCASIFVNEPYDMRAHGLLDFYYKEYETKTGIIKLQFKKLPGQDKCCILFTPRIKESNIILLFFNLSDKETFENLVEFDKIVRENSSPSKIILIGTKLNETSNREIKFEEACKFVDSHHYQAYFEVTIETNTNIQEVLEYILKPYNE